MLCQAASGPIAAKFPIGSNRIQLCQLRNHVSTNGRQKRVPITCSVKFPKKECFRDFTKRTMDFLNSWEIYFRFSAKGFPVMKIQRVPFLHCVLVLVKEGLKCYLLAWIAFHLLSGYLNYVFGSKRLLIPFSIFLGNWLSKMDEYEEEERKKEEDGRDNERTFSEYCHFSLEAGVSLGKWE